MTNRYWRLTIEEAAVLKRAASCLRAYQYRHAGARRAVKFIDALLSKQKDIDRCWKNPQEFRREAARTAKAFGSTKSKVGQYPI